MQTKITPSEKAKERFCKDCNLPISLFKEPYFTERLALYDPVYHCIEKWELFTGELSKYPTEQDYFEEYNRIKDEAIEYIKNTDGYNRFNSEDMNKYRVRHAEFPNKDIFKPSNSGRTFVSIDMKKANFSSLRNYSPDIFGGAKTWEEFVALFTSNEHIIGSKYIRQVILGNCNPKRHITYEKYLMDKVLTKLEEFVNLNRVVFFSNDEIVLDLSDQVGEQAEMFASQLTEEMQKMEIPLKTELFTLYQILGTNGYCKVIYEEGERVEFKCLNSFELPFVLRAYNGEKVTEGDKVFLFEKKLAHFEEVPEITFPFSRSDEACKQSGNFLVEREEEHDDR